MTAAPSTLSPEEEKLSFQTKPMSKRQRRKLGPNPSNTLPQQPKIKSMDARNKAYLHHAGFTSSATKKAKGGEDDSPLDPNRDLFQEDASKPWIISSSNKKKRKTFNDSGEHSNDPNATAEMKFGRLLASPDAKIRHKTLLKLQAYIKAKCAPDSSGSSGKDSSGTIKGFSHMDLMKLWKGLWHTLYLCDGVVVQEEVSKVLAQLLWCFGGSAEEDEYVARLYLEMEEANDGSVEMADDNGDNSLNDDNEEVPTLRNMDEDDSDMETDEMLDESLVREIRDKLKNVEEVSMEDSDDDVVEAKDDDDNGDDNEEEDDLEVKHCRGAHLAALYFRTYLITLTREWPNMDKYRIDKFYTLTRVMLREIYRYMARRHWTLGIVHIFNDALMEEVLRTNKTGNGIRFHVIDICLEELALVNSEDDVTALKLTEATILEVLEPFLAMTQLVEEGFVHQKVMDKVLLRFLEEYSVVSPNYNPEEIESAQKKLVMDQVHVGSVAQFIFSLAGDSVTMDRYRKDLYDMHKVYVRKIKAVGRDVALEEDDSEEQYDDQVDDTTTVETEDVPTNESKEKKISSETLNDVKEEFKVVEETTTQDESTTSGKKKKKSKKEKKKKSKKTQEQEKDNSSSTSKDVPTKEDSEDVITITVKEQKKAKKASALRKSKKAEIQSKAHQDETPSTPIPTTPGDSRTKRVQFSATNRSKSHKKSLKDLRKVDAKATLERTPEKSILLKKRKDAGEPVDTPVADGKKKRRKGTPHPKRKQAMDYF